MQVETYEVSEVRAECQDDKTELSRISSELGLDGQLKLLGQGDDASTFPYRKMTIEEERVYDVLLPSTCKLANFDESVIPLRVLQIASHAKQFKETAMLFVRYCPSSPDPILFGRSQEYGGDVYILARWGEVLESFEICRKKAQEKLVSIAKAKIAKAVSEVRSYEDGIEDRCASFLRGGEKYCPTVY